MTDRIEQDIVEISVDDYNMIVAYFRHQGLKIRNVIQTTYIPLPRFNLHIGDKSSFYYEFTNSYDESGENVGKILIVLQNSADNWGLFFNPNTKVINIFKHSKKELKGNNEEFKKAQHERRFAITAFFLIQHFLKCLPEVWKKTKESRQLTEKEIKELKKTGKKRVNKTKLINRYTFSLDELKRKRENNERTKVFMCPCWGVRGHYRHLKNGKIVWISAYRKGAKKNEENVYEKKTYILA